MKSSIQIFLIIIILQSCSKKNNNKDLLGNWSSTNSANIVDLQFYKDSMIRDSWDKRTKFLWKNDSLKIYCNQLTNIEPEIKTEFTLEYKLNEKKDTLYLKNETDSSFTIELLKINNAYQYFQKNINLDIDLETKENGILISGNKKFDYNIYVGYKNDELIAKSDQYINLNGMSTESLHHIYSFEEQNENQFKYLLFVDKKVPKKQYDSIISILKNSKIKNIFRVYTNDKVDYTKTNWKSELN